MVTFLAGPAGGMDHGRDLRRGRRLMARRREILTCSSGHYGVALGLKRAEPKVSLGTLFVAAQLVDLLWGAFLMLGWEHVRILPDENPLLKLQFYDYPISHSLAGAVGWGRPRPCVLLLAHARHDAPLASLGAGGAAVASHWLLDLIVHVPDLPLAGNDSPKFGLGLWRHVGASVALELAVLTAGLVIYARGASRRHPFRPVRIGCVLAVLLATYRGIAARARAGEHARHRRRRHRVHARDRRARCLGGPGGHARRARRRHPAR